MKKTSKRTAGSQRRSPRRPRKRPDALGALAALLAKLELRWYLFGAQAVNRYPRATADLDVTIELGESSMREFLDAIEDAYRGSPTSCSLRPRV